MIGDTDIMSRRSQRRPKDAQGKAPYPHDARTTVEEAVVWLTSLQEYSGEELTQPELEFLKVACRNLARIHRRLSRGQRGS